MVTEKQIIGISIKVLGEMFRSSAFNDVTVYNMAFDAVKYAIEICKESKSQLKELAKQKINNNEN
jgi:hypothetical protein